jgi:hypothetical protein
MEMQLYCTTEVRRPSHDVESPATLHSKKILLRYALRYEGQAPGRRGQTLLVIAETVSVAMAGDDQGHHVFEVELETF